MTASAAELFDAEQRDGARETARHLGLRNRTCQHDDTGRARAHCGFCADRYATATGPLDAVVPAVSVESED